MTSTSARAAAPAALGEDYGYCFRHGAATDTAPRPSKWAQLRKAKELLPEQQRFQACNYNAKKRALFVSIYARGESSWFEGVMRCGSVWICPVCARRIAEGRRADLQDAIDNTIRKDCGVILVTLTFPHGAGDVLADILDRFAKAQRIFKSGRAAAALREHIGFMGEVRTLEVTHGVNGWHPHAHSLWFTDKKLSQDEMATLRDDLYQLWFKACLKAGLPEPSHAHGVDVRGARYAGEYVAKWGFASELAVHTNKRGKKESAGRTPWELLAHATEGDRRAGWLWREFALAFFGRRQLFWSRGLRDKLKLAPELTEQALMEIEDTRARQVVMLDLDTWYVVRKTGAQAYVLELALGDLRELYAYLNMLRTNVPMEHGRPPGPRADWIT